MSAKYNGSKWRLEQEQREKEHRDQLSVIFATDALYTINIKASMTALNEGRITAEMFETGRAYLQRRALQRHEAKLARKATGLS